MLKTILSPGRLSAGRLTIIDLTDLFIDAASVFKIVVRLFLRAKIIERAKFFIKFVNHTL